MKTPYSVQPISDIARELELRDAWLEPYGHNKAKVDLEALEPDPTVKGRLILVSAINPTPAGEGKTTTSIALAMGMRRQGHRVTLALREPSLGPVFGIKGGGTGGGRSTLEPSNDINLHFTGDIHAITSAHNLLAAMVDNSLHFHETFSGKGMLDARTVTWNRVLDMNDRALRDCVIGLGGKAQGIPRQSRFDITAASEVMAIMALSSSYSDLETRLKRILVGMSSDNHPITAEDLGAAGAMVALLRDALKPNLVQTAEGGPALVHCGPFGNIAHGCNSVIATRMALAHSDYVITEAGFGFDLGGEKFLNIKCRQLGAWPSVLVLVATLRALKMHGGAPVKVATEPDRLRLEQGMVHLHKHLQNAATFGLPVVVAVNVFPQDSEEELVYLEQHLRIQGIATGRSDGFTRGGEGCLELSDLVRQVADKSDDQPPEAQFSYSLEMSLEEKVRNIARVIYGADDVVFTPTAEKDLKRIRDLGGAALPICMAKTQLSLSDDPAKVGRPSGFTVTVRELRLCAGAGYVVALTGDMMTMPGLPKIPAARQVRLDAEGKIRGLMQGD